MSTHAGLVRKSNRSLPERKDGRPSYKLDPGSEAPLIMILWAYEAISCFRWTEQIVAKVQDSVSLNCFKGYHLTVVQQSYRLVFQRLDYAQQLIGSYSALLADL